MDKQTLREVIGLRIKRAREKKGLTIRQLADMSGVPYTNISLIESGKKNATLDTIEKLITPLKIW